MVELDAAIRELAPRLVRYGISRLGDADLAEEVAQDSLTALVRHWRSQGQPASAEAFVFAIARRRIGRAVWRRRFSRPLDLVVGVPDAGPGPESVAVGRIERERVRKALSRLGRCDRDALLLVAVGGLKHADAAEALGLSVSAVKMRLLRARARLAALLEEGETR